MDPRVRANRLPWLWACPAGSCASPAPPACTAVPWCDPPAESDLGATVPLLAGSIFGDAASLVDSRLTIKPAGPHPPRLLDPLIASRAGEDIRRLTEATRLGSVGCADPLEMFKRILEQGF